MLFCYVGIGIEDGDDALGQNQIPKWSDYIQWWLRKITSNVPDAQVAYKNGNLVGTISGKEVREDPKWFQVSYDVSLEAQQRDEVVRILKTLIDDASVGLGIMFVDGRRPFKSGDKLYPPLTTTGGGWIETHFGSPWWFGTRTSAEFMRVWIDSSCAEGFEYVINDVHGNFVRSPGYVILWHELAHGYSVLIHDSALHDETAATELENILRARDGLPLRSNDHSTAPNAGKYFQKYLRIGEGGCVGGSACLIATAATGSPLSAEVQILRRTRDLYLRAIEVGFDFCEHLFADYYTFSPELSEMMIADLSLLNIVRECVVGPITMFFLLLDAYARSSETELPKEAREILRRTSPATALSAKNFRVLSGLLGVGGMPSDWPLATPVIQRRAWPSPWIQWTLLDVLGMMWHWGLQATAENEEQAFAELLVAMEDWLARIPLSSIWASLSTSRLEQELRLLSTTLFRAPQVREALGRRLASRLDAEGRGALDRAGYLVPTS